MHRPWTAFFGRENDLERLRALLRSQRLVTLVGPTGIGKTRLALESFPDAVFVELAGVRGAEGVVSAFCRALSIENIGPMARAAEVLGHALVAIEASVVVDGCDDVRDELATLLRTLVPKGRRFVCTSRQPLEVPGEQRWYVEPLPREHAEALFLDRARLVVPELVLEPEDRDELDAILSALGGFPLAIELVAAQVLTLGLEGLRRRLSALPLEPLRDVIAGSTTSLSVGARESLVRLSVFAGSFDLRSAEAVLAGIEDADAQLRVLVDASLVRSMGTARHRRFRLYEPVRAYAQWALEQDLRAHVQAHTAHVQHHLEVSLSLLDEGSVWSLEQVRAIEELVPELRAADAALRASLVEFDNPAEARCRLVSAIEPVIVHRGALPDFAAWIAEAAQLARCNERISPSLRARVLALHALVVQRQGLVDETVALYLEAGSMALASGDDSTLAYTWLRWVAALVVWGRLPEAIAAADAFLERVEEPHARAVARMYRAMACLFVPTATDEALADLRQAVLELDRRGDRRAALIGQANLALFLVYLGRLAPAKPAFDDLVVDDHADAHARNSVLANRALCLHELAFAAEPFGDPTLADRAEEGYREGAAAFARAGARPYRALVNAHHAMFLFERGAFEEAEHTAIECLNEQPDPRTSAIAHAELASMRARRGAIDDARALLRKARSIASEANISDVTVLHGLELHDDLVSVEERATAGVRKREESARLRSKLERYATFDVGAFSPRVRMAARLLAHALDETPSSRRPDARADWQGSLVVGRDEAWLRSPCGEQADLSQRPKLRALVGNLVRRHEAARGRPVPAADLIAEVWPDERFVGHAGRTRLHTLVFALRGLGLRDVIQSTPAGYCLDPSLPVVRAEF